MAQYSLQDFGKRIKKVRTMLGLTQKQLGEGLNLSHSFISDVESGKSKACYDFFYNISNTYNVNLYYLVYGEGEVFGKAGTVSSLEDQEVGKPVEKAEELIWYIYHSPLLMHTLMGFATKFIYDNEAIVKKDIENYKSKEEKNHD